MKKLINPADDVVHEIMQGFVARYGRLPVLPDHQVLLRADPDVRR